MTWNERHPETFVTWVGSYESLNFVHIFSSMRRNSSLFFEQFICHQERQDQFGDSRSLAALVLILSLKAYFCTSQYRHQSQINQQKVHLTNENGIFYFHWWLYLSTSLGIHSYNSTYTHLQKLTARQLHYSAFENDLDVGCRISHCYMH